MMCPCHPPRCHLEGQIEWGVSWTPSSTIQIFRFGIDVSIAKTVFLLHKKKKAEKIVQCNLNTLLVHPTSKNFRYFLATAECRENATCQIWNLDEHSLLNRFYKAILAPGIVVPENLINCKRAIIIWASLRIKWFEIFGLEGSPGFFQTKLLQPGLPKCKLA